MAITTTSNLTGLVKTAFDMAVLFAFQPHLRFAQLAEQKRWDLSEAPVPGDQITFTVFGSLTAATHALPESSDPTEWPLTSTAKTVPLVEQGKIVTTTQRLRVVSFANIDLSVGKVVGDNMGVSVDLLARAAFDATMADAYVSYTSGAAMASIIDSPGSRLKSADVRYAANRLSRENVPFVDGETYAAVVHPDCILDLRSEVGSGSFRAPKEYVDPEDLYAGEIGRWESFRFVESMNCLVSGAGGSGGTVDVYSNYFIGFQAVGFADGISPHMIVAPPADAFQRLLRVSWFGLFGYGELRPEALHKVFSSSSVGINV